jgi:hypothetical protein
MTAVSGLSTRPFADSSDSLLRFAMRADATLTGLAGLVVAVAADPISSLSGLSSVQEYALGTFFVFYGLAVFSLAALPNLRRAGICVVVANIVCTVAAVAVVAAHWLPSPASGWYPQTTPGVVATLATGVYTAFFGYLQYLGVRRLPA